jgi:hypothetical protein
VGGRPQRAYEHLRATALAGGDVSLFLRWGMTLLGPSGNRRSHSVWEIRRRRAPVRAGEFPLVEFLVEMGIAEPPRQRSSGRSRAMEVVS